MAANVAPPTAYKKPFVVRCSRMGKCRAQAPPAKPSTTRAPVSVKLDGHVGFDSLPQQYVQKQLQEW